MFPFFPFFFILSKSTCKYLINVDENNPMTYNFNLDENEFICINSTLPYLTVLFQPTQLLRINAYKKTNDGLEFLTTSYSPGIYGGFDFSNEIGSMDIESILPGFLSISLFAFPKECSKIRYVTNLDADYFTLDTKFENFKANSTICIWYGSLHYYFKGKFLDETKPTNEILICNNEKQNQENHGKTGSLCYKYVDYRSLPSLKNIYFKITPTSDHFIRNYLFRFNSSYIVKDSIHVANILDENKWSEIEIEVSNLIQLYSHNTKDQFNRDAQTHESIFDDKIASSLIIVFTCLLIILASLSVFIFTNYCIKKQNRSRNINYDERIPLLPQPQNQPQNLYFQYNNNNNNPIFSRFYNQPYFQQGEQYFYNPQFFSPTQFYSQQTPTE